MPAANHLRAAALVDALNVALAAAPMMGSLSLHPGEYDADLLSLVAAWVQEHRTAENRLRFYEKVSTADTGGAVYRYVVVYIDERSMAFLHWDAEYPVPVGAARVDGDAAPMWRPYDEMAVTCG